MTLRVATSTITTRLAQRQVTHSCLPSAVSSMSSGPGGRPVMSPTLVSVCWSMMLIVPDTRLDRNTCRLSPTARTLCAALPVGMRLTLVWVRQSITST
jgi:hypothetical protein